LGKMSDEPVATLHSEAGFREPPPTAAQFFRVQKIWPEIGRKYRRLYRFPANIPVANHLKTNPRLLFHRHGMEEVVGSIPTRCTIFNHLQTTIFAGWQHLVATCRGRSGEGNFASRLLHPA